MQQPFGRTQRVLEVLLFLPCPPPHSPPFRSSRFFCCGETPAPSSQHHQQLSQKPGHGELPRSCSRTQEGSEVREPTTHEDICGDCSLAQKDDGHSKPDFEQASSFSGNGDFNLLHLDCAQQGKVNNHYPSHGKPVDLGEADSCRIEHGRYMQKRSFPMQDVPHAARRILHGLDMLGDQADPSTYTSLLEIFSNFKSVSNGKLVHDHIISRGFEHDDRLGALILEMYCKCDALEDALFLFEKRQRPCDAPIWNIMMRTLNDQRDGERALQLYERMHLEGVLPNKVTYISLASVCAALAESCKGVILHATYVCGIFDSDVVLGTAIMNMYAKCGRVADVRRLFDCMPDRNVITWTTYITAHTQLNEQKQSLQIFYQMHQEGQIPNRVTYVNTAPACASLEDLANGRRIHVLMLGNEVDRDVVVMTAFADMYGKCTSAKDALEVLTECVEWNLVTWNSVIASMVNCGQEKEASVRFMEMQQQGVLPDRITFLNLIYAYSSVPSHKQGNQLHACIMGTGFHSDVMLNNALINMCAKLGQLCLARKAFEEMSEKNVVSWNTIITAYAQSKQGRNACRLFHQMQEEGILADKVSCYGYFDGCGIQKDLVEGSRVYACLLHSGVSLDAFLVTAIISMYGKCGSLEQAKGIFDEFSDHNILTWNALLSAYAQHEVVRTQLLFYQLIWEGMVPSAATFVGLLNAYKNEAFLADGERLHTVILHTGYLKDVSVANALINMYSKCGNLTSAQVVLDNMPERDVVSWTTIIGAYGEHGQGSMALKIFKEMLNHTVPDAVTFLNVLAACNRSGLIEDGDSLFNSMRGKYGISPNEDHYSCMIDLLGRAGRVGEAESLMEQMPLEPSYRAWVAFLGACRYAGDVTRAEFTALYLVENHHESHQPLVLLANVYALAGRREDAAWVRSMIMILQTDPISPILFWP